MYSRSCSNKVRVWNACAVVAVLGLAFPMVIQECFHRSYVDQAPYGYPKDFPHYYMGGKVAGLKPPENILYYPPFGSSARSYKDLRTDGSTPYGKLAPPSGLPAGAVNLPFDAPPWAALMMEPLALLSWRMAYLLWQAVCILLVTASIYLALHLSQGRPPSLLTVAIGLALVFFFLPFKDDLIVGNINTVVCFLWVLGVFLLNRGNAVASASCFALGTAIKVSPIFALPLLAMRRQWRWLAAYGIAGSLLLAFSVWRVGWTNDTLWIGQVAPILSKGIITFWNRSLAGFLFALGEPHRLLTEVPSPAGWGLLIKAVSASCYCAFLAGCWKHTKDSKGLLFEMIFLPLIVLLVSPISWPHYYVLALLPLTYLWLRSREAVVVVSNLDMALLTCSTLIIGSPLPYYDVARTFGPAGGLLVIGMWISATLALVWVGMRMYGGCATNERGAALAANAATEPVMVFSCRGR